MRLCLPSTRLALRGTLRRALDTRIVLRSTMTPISPTSSSRRASRLSPYSSSTLLLFFFHSTYASFLMYLFHITWLKFLSSFVCGSLNVYLAFLSALPILTHFKYSTIYKFTLVHSPVLFPLVINLTFILHVFSLYSFSQFSFPSLLFATCTHRSTMVSLSFVNPASLSVLFTSGTVRPLRGLARN